MAEYDKRQSGGYQQRKRRHRDDDDQYDRRQRRRVDHAPPPVQLRRQLTRIADSPLRRWSDEVLSIARLVANNYEDEDFRESFIGLVMQLVIEQPLKTPFISAAVLAVNSMRSEVVHDLLARVAPATEAKIRAGHWRDVKLYLKFLACLHGCLDGDGLFPLLEELFSRAADLQTASSEDTIGTEIVKIILLTIPYVMAAAPGRFTQRAADLMEKTDIIASEPHALQTLVDPYHPDGDEPSPAAESSVCMLLQKQLQTEAANDWPLACIPRPWEMPLDEVEAQEKIASAPKHPVPAIFIPEVVQAGPRILFPEVYFSVYSDQEVESVPPRSSIAASLIRDGLTDAMNILDFNRNATARYLMDIDCYFAEGTFIKRATPFDELKNFPSGRSTWKPEDVAVDTVFSQLLQLPAPEHKLVYYHSILTEACKLAPAAIAPSLGRTIRFLYRNNPCLDLELSYRFVNWFAHHLSNFGFTWKWTEWGDDVGLPDLDPRKWFLIGALDKEVRLSFAQRIQKTLPDAYQSLIGPDKAQDQPEFKFNKPDTPLAKEGQDIAKLLRQKAPPEEIQEVMTRIQAQASELVLDPVVASMDVYMTALCFVGSKSLSHVLACIDRSRARLLEMSATSKAARTQMITSVMDYWHAHPGIALSIIENLLNYSILTPFAVVDWALLADSPIHGTGRGASLGQPHIFELVINTVTKVTRRTRHVLTSPDCPAEEREKETKGMRDLLRAVNDALSSWAGGSKDELMEDGDGSSARETLIRRWGQRWSRVFRRVAAIEEVVVLEATAARSQDAAATTAASAPEADGASEPDGAPQGN